MVPQEDREEYRKLWKTLGNSKRQEDLMNLTVGIVKNKEK